MRHWLPYFRSSYPDDRWLVFNAPKAFEHPACQIRVSACRHHMKPLLKIRTAQRHRRRAGELFCGPIIDRAVSTGNDRLRSPVCVAEAAIADDFDASAEISQYRFLQTHRVKGGRVVERPRHPAAIRVRALPRHDPAIELQNLRLQHLQLGAESGDTR